MARPIWILDFHEDFPGSALVAEQVSDAIVITERDARLGRWPNVSGSVVGYGTMHTMIQLQRVPGLRKGVFDDYRRLRCSEYYRMIYDLLGRVCVFVPFTALPLLPLAAMFGPQVFVRSDSNYKLFPAATLNVDEVTHWLDLYSQHADELVVVSEVVRFDEEYRCFCRNGIMFCGSSYHSEPYMPVPDNVQAFAETTARRLFANGINMVTIDVGVTYHDGTQHLRVVEVGGVNSWGVYGANVDDFIQAMESEAISRASHDLI